MSAEDASLAPAAAAWPFTPESPAVAGLLRTDRPLSLMLVDLTGLDWPGIEPLLPVACEVARERGMAMLLLVDLADYRGLRASGLAYDSLPSASANARLAPEEDWAAYLALRRALLRARWQPDVIIQLGTGPEWDP